MHTFGRLLIFGLATITLPPIVHTVIHVSRDTIIFNKVVFLKPPLDYAPVLILIYLNIDISLVVLCVDALGG